MSVKQFWIWINVPCLILFINIEGRTQTEAIKIDKIEQVWEIALNHNPQRSSYTSNIEKADADYKASRSFLLPSISGSFAGQDNLKLAVTPVPGELIGKPNTTFYAQFGKQFTYNAGITASKTLMDIQSIRSSQVAKNSVLQRRAEAEAFDQQLKQQTARYYYAALIAKKSIETSEQDQEVGDSVVMLVRQRLQEGLADSASLNQAQINRNNIHLGLAQNKLIYQQSIINLTYWMGLPNGTLFEFSEQLIPPAALSALDLGENKSLNTFNYQMKEADLHVQIQRSAFVPKLSISSYLGKQQYRNDFGMSFSNGSWYDYRYLSLNMTIPIFTGFGNRNRLSSAKSSKEILTKQFEDARNSYSAADSITVNSLTYNIEMATTAADNCQLYMQLFKLNHQKFKQGLISLDSLLQSFEEYLNAENIYLNSFSNVYMDYSIFLSRQ